MEPARVFEGIHKSVKILALVGREPTSSALPLIDCSRQSVCPSSQSNCMWPWANSCRLHWDTLNAGAELIKPCRVEPELVLKTSYLLTVKLFSVDPYISCRAEPLGQDAMCSPSRHRKHSQLFIERRQIHVFLFTQLFLANSAKSGSPTSVQGNFCLTERWCCK